MSNTTDAKTQVHRLCLAIEDKDVEGALRLLDQGCATSHPEIDAEPLQLALRQGSEKMIAALLDAGADLTNASYKTGISWVVHLGCLRAISTALECGVIPVSDIDSIFFDAASNGAESIALRMLELGADPARSEMVGSKRRSAFAISAMRGHDAVACAILARLAPAELDSLLHVHARQGDAACVRLLLGAGADAARRINGRTLLQLTPRDAHDVKRMLRSIGTAKTIEQAMGSNECRSEPVKHSLTL